MLHMPSRSLRFGPRKDHGRFLGGEVVAELSNGEHLFHGNKDGVEKC